MSNKHLKRYPLFTKFQLLFIMEKIIQENLKEIKLLLKKHGVLTAILFGSAARGNMDKNSDLDFLLNFQPGMDYELYANNYFSLSRDLERLLHKKVDIISEKNLRNPFLIESINQSKVQIL